MRRNQTAEGLNRWQLVAELPDCIGTGLDCPTWRMFGAARLWASAACGEIIRLRDGDVSRIPSDSRVNDGGRAAGFPNSAGLLRDCLIAPAPGWFVGLPDAPTRSRYLKMETKAKFFAGKVCLNPNKLLYLHSRKGLVRLRTKPCNCGNSSVGRAQPCQGWGREFESRFPLKNRRLNPYNKLISKLWGFFVYSG